MTEQPITIGGQTFIKTEKGWVDRKTKILASEETSRLLDTVSSNNTIPANQPEPSKKPHRYNKKINHDDIDELRSIIKELTETLSTQSKVKPGEIGRNASEGVSVTSELKRGMKETLLGAKNQETGEVEKKSVTREILEKAFPVVAKSIFSAKDASDASKQFRMDVKENTKPVLGDEKVITLLQRVSQTLEKILNISITGKGGLGTLPTGTPEKKKEIDFSEKPLTFTGALKQNLKEGILGSRNKETGEVEKTGLVKSFIMDASPLIGGGILSARDRSIESKKKLEMVEIEKQQKEKDKQKENKPKIQNTDSPTKTSDRLIETTTIQNVDSPTQISSSTKESLASQTEKMFENEYSSKTDTKSELSVIVSDISSSAIDKIKNALSQTLPPEKTSPVEPEMEPKAGGMGSLLTGAIASGKNLAKGVGGVIAAGASTLGGIAGKFGLGGKGKSVSPLEEVRRNSAGRAIDAKGRFVKEVGEKTAENGILKTLGKDGAKVAEKGLLKGAAKSALKKIPGIGLLAGIGFGAGRLMDGDVLGAGMEVASGAASTVPGPGTAASLGIDAALVARDLKPEPKETSVTPRTRALIETSKQNASAKNKMTAEAKAPTVNSNINAPKTTVNNSSKTISVLPTVGPRGSLDLNQF